jgi:hypothetical protein
MMSRLNQYLLTHHPLVWNSRVIPLLIANAIIHLLFLVAGYASITPALMGIYYGVSGIGDGGLYFFAILLSIVVLITWLIFFLRNNAFKQFYILRPWHLVKEFLIIFIVLLTTITYFESFITGGLAKARQITSKELLLKEANIVNTAMAFIPFERESYFVNNSCSARNRKDFVESQSVLETAADTLNHTDSIARRVREALLKPDAFSYRHFCIATCSLSDSVPGFLYREAINARVNRWIANNQRDSIRYILNECVAILKKYDGQTNISVDVLTALPFATPYNNITRIGSAYFDYNTNLQEDKNWYFTVSSISRALSFADDCHNDSWGERFFALLAELYVALGLAILLLCYRRFSRKVFLASLIGGILWFLFFSLVGVAGRGLLVPGYFYLLLFGAFTLIGLVLVRNNQHKTIAGVMLCWHMAMLPGLVMTIAAILSTENYYSGAYDSTYDPLAFCTLHPVTCWVRDNILLIAWVNLFAALLYVLFVFNPLTRRWHAMAEE